MPMNSEPMMSAIVSSVVLAFLASGRRKAETPLEIASTPVSAVVPAAKARRIRKKLTAPKASPVWNRGWLGSAW